MNIIFDIETDGLNPIDNRITAIGLKTEKEEIILMDKDEAIILQQFWQYLKQFQSFRLIGFNNYSFDNYFVNIRCFKHKIKIIDVRNKIIDLRLILSYGGKFKNGTLDDYSQLLGFKKYLDSGEIVIDAWKNQKLDLIEKYLRQDLKLTYMVFQRCQEVGLI